MKRLTRVLLAILFLPSVAIHAQSGNKWEQMPGTAKDIGVGGDGSVWIIGTNRAETANNFGIHRWKDGKWVGVDGGGVRIAVDPSGAPWIANYNGEIFQRVDNQWKRLPGFAKDIGIGGDGSVWIVGTNPMGTANNFGIHKWTGNKWVGVNGGGVRIAVDPSGTPWIVNFKGEIFRLVKDHWKRLPGFAKDISAGKDGSVWIIGTNAVGTANNFGIHRWTGTDWVGIDGAGVQISVDDSGLPWIVNSKGKIFRLR